MKRQRRFTRSDLAKLFAELARLSREDAENSGNRYVQEWSEGRSHAWDSARVLLTDWKDSDLVQHEA